MGCCSNAQGMECVGFMHTHSLVQHASARTAGLASFVRSASSTSSVQIKASQTSPVASANARTSGVESIARHVACSVQTRELLMMNVQSVTASSPGLATPALCVASTKNASMVHHRQTAAAANARETGLANIVTSVASSAKMVSPIIPAQPASVRINGQARSATSAL